jgi:hypothetical protein
MKVSANPGTLREPLFHQCFMSGDEQKKDDHLLPETTGNQSSQGLPEWKSKGHPW